MNYIKAEQSFVIYLAARYPYFKLIAAHTALDKAHGYKGNGDDAQCIPCTSN